MKPLQRLLLLRRLLPSKLYLFAAGRISIRSAVIDFGKDDYMEKISFVRKTQPTVCEILGQRIRLLFTMGAASEMEDVFAQPYLQTVCDMLQVSFLDDGTMAPPLSIEQQAQIIVILARAAGQKLEVADLQMLPMVDFTILAQAAQSEILAKTPWSKGDGGKKA